MIRPVLLDCDTGIDDALALIYLAGLHKAGEINLVAVTCTAGNVSAIQSAANSQYILRRCGITDIPVQPGEPSPLRVPLTTTPETHGRYGLGYLDTTADAADILATATARGQRFEQSWRELWSNALSTYGDDLQLIVTGPATNLATYLNYGVELPQNITMMGGAYLYPGNTTPTAEWNTWVDPDAAKAVFAHSPRPVTACSLEVTEQLLCTPEFLAELIDELGEYCPVSEDLPEMLRFYFEFHKSMGQGYMAQVHDVLTCMIALGVIRYSYDTVHCDVEAGTDAYLTRGTTVVDRRRSGANARLVTSSDIRQARQEWLRSARLLGSVEN